MRPAPQAHAPPQGRRNKAKRGKQRKAHPTNPPDQDTALPMDVDTSAHGPKEKKQGRSKGRETSGKGESKGRRMQAAMKQTEGSRHDPEVKRKGKIQTFTENNLTTAGKSAKYVLNSLFSMQSSTSLNVFCSWSGKKSPCSICWCKIHGKNVAAFVNNVLDSRCYLT